jgi:putative transposase
VLDAIRDVCWERGADGVVRLRPEGLYGRRTLTAFLRRTSTPTVAQCTVVRATKTLGHQGIRRAKTHRTTIPAKDGIRAGDLLNWSAPAPNANWVTDVTCYRTWAGFVDVAFMVDCFAQRVAARYGRTAKTTELVMTPLRMAIWQRDRDGHPTARGGSGGTH